MRALISEQPLRASRAEPALIGRDAELMRLFGLLSGERLPRILSITGEAGSGKSALAATFCELASMRRHASLLLPRSDFAPGLDGARRAVARAAEFVAGAASRAVIIVFDGFNEVLDLDLALHQAAFWRVRSPVLTLVCSLGPFPEVGDGWDPDRPPVERMPLAGLRPSEAGALLGSAGLTGAAVEEAIGFAGGNPLGLALYARWFQAGLELESGQDEMLGRIRELMLRLIADVPAAALPALDAASVLRHATPDLLALLTRGQGDVAVMELSRTGLPRAGRNGLSLPHVIASAVRMDLRSRNPARYAGMKRLALDHQLLELDSGRCSDVEEALDVLYLSDDTTIRTAFFGSAEEWIPTLREAAALERVAILERLGDDRPVRRGCASGRDSSRPRWSEASRPIGTSNLAAWFRGRRSRACRRRGRRRCPLPGCIHLGASRPSGG